MSNRKSLSQSNTLLNYFQSPKGKITPKKLEKSYPAETKDEPNLTNTEDEDVDDVIKMPKKKKARVLSDDESEPNQSEKNPQKKRSRCSSDQSEEENETPNKQAPKKTKTDLSQFSKLNTENTPTPKKSSQKSEENADTPKKSPQKSDQNNVTVVEADIHSSWVHNSLKFLKPENIRDKNRKKPNDPEYDEHTLYVPDDFLNKQTPAMRQWWILKSDHFDSVLFFKVGKFYELYHMDACVGVEHLGFSYMKGEFAHSGFPESAYGKMASTLIDKGFKVARVEQTETPDMMNERIKGKKSTKYDKVVAREICQISTKATTVYNAQLSETNNSLPCYLYAVAEKVNGKNSSFGVCFIDTSIGTFHLSQFDDDKFCSRMLALLAEKPPGLILTEKANLESRFKKIAASYFTDIRNEQLLPKKQFYSAQTTLEKLSTACYFKDKDGNFHWPEFFKTVADDCLPKQEYKLALSALGACLWYLEDSEIDIQVVSQGKFELYTPLDMSSKPIQRDYMVLDSATIQNLGLLGSKGTLQSTLDHCETAFGKRLLTQWICRPLCDTYKITERQKAVSELWNNPSLLKSTQDILKKLPDLERQVAKIHTYGNKFCSSDHPDGRAIFYEADTYSKRKIQDLLKTLKAFESVQDIRKLFNSAESKLLKKLTQAPKDGGMFINLKETLNFFKEAFDHKQAEEKGKIFPKKGVDADYDECEYVIESLNGELKAYLQEQSKKFGCEITYFGADKKRFQLDIPDSKNHKADHNYQLEGSRKGKSKRYHTAETREFLSRMLKAEAEKTKVVLDLNRRIFEKFSQRRDEWDQVIQCLTVLDVLCSFAEYSKTYSHDICIPTIKPMENNNQIIKIEEGRHPCLANVENFVPNDIQMGTEDHANMLILTGPNMGGKSTLMREVAVILVMAQMGCSVPAASCEVNLIDRIFTRLGAQDAIIQGQSTFFVELSEASTILKHSTRNSLVLLDELGRGTSTHDGNAIATAYVKKLLEVKCRTMFATHYHTLVDNFHGREDIQLGHMACMVENDEDPTEESVTFLYKLSKGRCPKSYGFNAARLAGLKQSIVARGREVAKVLEKENNNRIVFRDLVTLPKNVEDIRKLIGSISI